MYLCRFLIFLSQPSSQVAATLQNTIQSNTAALPKAEEAKAEANSNRPIPPFNADANRLSEVGSHYIYHHLALRVFQVYNLDDIVPSVELSAISMATILGREDGKGANLPWSRSQWINRHFNHLTNKPNKADKDEDKLWVHRLHCAHCHILMPFQKGAVLYLLHARFQEGSI